MKTTWGKLILFFQAVVTLLIGLVFFAQFVNIAATRLMKMSHLENESFENEPMGTHLKEVENIESRFKVASYIVVFVSLIELIIIARIFS